MMRPIWLGLLLLTACHSENNTPASAPQSANEPRRNTAPSTALPPPDTADTKAVSAVSDTLRVVRQRRNFSHSEGPADFFQLVFRGPSILEGNAEFTITNPEGDVIFREMLTEPDLEAALVYEMKNPTAARAERETFVLRRLNEFFQLTQFDAPAINPKATFPTGIANLDPATWNDLRQRPDAVGFDYLKGKEDRRRIAWSPLKKQVVRVR